MSSTTAMPVLWLLVLGALLGGQLVLARGLRDSSSNDVADRLAQEIDNFKDLMPTGSVEYSIPCLEPAVVPKIPINAKASVLTATGVLNNLMVSGLSSFTVTKMEPIASQTTGTSSSCVTIGIEIPTVSANTVYDLKGKLKVSFFSVKINGESKVIVTVTGITGSADVCVTINTDQSITVDSISNVNYSYKKAKVNVDKMTGIVNSLINKLIPSIVKSNGDNIKKVIQTQGKEFANKYFNTVAGKTNKVALSAAPSANVLSTLADNFVVTPESEYIIMQIIQQLQIDSTV